MSSYLRQVSLLSASKSEIPDRLLRRLQIGWGNSAYGGSRSFLAAVVRLITTTQGAVLECGSGLSTLIAAAALAPDRPLVSLEHHEQWLALVKANAQIARCANVSILNAPLISYGAYSWYGVDHLTLPACFGLVICDGPPGDTPGGRYGLVPVLRKRLLAGTLVLLDDTQRQSEQDIAIRWQRELPADILERAVSHCVLQVR